jgi:hypothetical protein
MSQFRKKPIVIEATPWFRNGDHPHDFGPADERLNREGGVVRYYRHPDVDGENLCQHCRGPMHDHGWIDTLEGGHIVCPGDWIITGVAGERYPCKPDIFAQTYEASDAPTCRDVLQKWVGSLSVMQQTVLLTATRGPDGTPKYGPAKMLLRWYRRCVLLSAMDGCVLPTPYAFGGGSFTGPSYDPTTHVHDWEPIMDGILGNYLRELDALPHHFQLHFMHAAQIVGFKHSDSRIRAWWQRVYNTLAHDMHLFPETEEQLDRRLGDSRDQWLERNHPATVD